MAKKKSSFGFLKFLFLLLIVALAAYFTWQFKQHGVLWDQSALSGKYEAQTDDILVAFNIKDSDIKAEREEKKSSWPLPLSWVETEKTIYLPSFKNVQALEHRLTAFSKTMRMRLLSKQTSEQTIILEYGRLDQIFERFIFVLSAKAQKHVEPPSKKESGRVYIALVIDDIAGRSSDIKKLDDFFSLPIPMTYAVLPQERHTAACVEKINQKGAELILHQPMEAENASKHIHGRFAMWNKMTEPELRELLQKNLASVQNALGVSNHMGSHFTSDKEAMQRFVSAYKSLMGQVPLFFFDSATTSKFVVGSVCKQANIPTARNDIFLDNQDDLAAMKKQLSVLKKIALRQGHASAIAHIQRKHIIQALQETIPEFQREGIEFVNLSDFISRLNRS